MKLFEYNQSHSNVKYAASGLIAAAFVALIATSPLVHADLAHADGDQKHCDHQHWNQERRSEHFEKRQQALHDKLALTANQEAAWNTFVAKTKPSERHGKADWSELSKLSTPERLDRMLAKAKEREQRFEVRVQATKDLYKQLTPAQQKVFYSLHQTHGDEHHHNERR